MPADKLEKLLGHRFSSPELLEQALTHTSWSHENRGDSANGIEQPDDNERMEFVGDSVVGLVIAEKLFRMNPSMSEGDLTLMKHRLVSTTTLAEIADSIGLGDYLRIGRGEERTGGRNKQAILAGTLEAVIAAIFLDSGYISACNAIERVFADRIRRATPAGSLDFKSLLQERLQASGASAPIYSVTKSEGQPHDRTFYVEVKWGTGKAAGTGRSIKAAEMAAAEIALALFVNIAVAVSTENGG